MISRQLAPAFEQMPAIDLTDFVISIICSEQAIKVTIENLKAVSNCQHNRGMGLI